MTNLNATIVIDDKISQSVLDKIDAIGVKAEAAANKVKLLQERLNSTNAKSLNNAALNSGGGDSLASRAAISGGSRAQMKLTGIDQTTKKLAAFDRQMKSVSNSANSFMNTIAFGSFAGSILSLGENYTKLTNKLMLVSESLDVAKGRFAALAAIGNATYTSVDSLVPLFTRLDLALGQIGTSASDVMQVTENLSKAITLSGLSTAEMNSALTQISQAFNKGKLDGDEFRSVMENMPLLADALAKKLGVTRGELLKLAPAGKITAEIMRDAILDMTDSVDAKFSELTPTVGMHLAKLSNQVTTYFGALMDNADFSDRVGKMLGFVGNNIDLLSKAAAGLTIVMGAAFAIAPVLRFAVGIKSIAIEFAKATAVATTFGTKVRAGLGALLLTNPFAAAIVGAISLLSYLSLIEDESGDGLFESFEIDKQRADDIHSRLEDILNTKKEASKVQLVQNTKDAGEGVEAYSTQLEKLEEQLKKLSYEQAVLQGKVELNKRGFGESSTYVSRYTGQMLTSSEASKELAENTKELNEVNGKLGDIANETGLILNKQRDLQLGQIELLEEQRDRVGDYIEKLEENVRKSEEGGQANQYLADKLTEAQTEFRTLSEDITEARAKLQGYINLASTIGFTAGGATGGFAKIALSFEAAAREKVSGDQKMLAEMMMKGGEYNTAKAQGKTVKQSRLEQANSKVLKERERQLAVAANNYKKGSKAYEDVVKGIDLSYQETLENNKSKFKVDEGKGGEKGGGRKSGGRKSNKERLTDEQKALKEATKDWQDYIDKQKAENDLLSIGYDNWTKYRDLYNEVIEARNAGVKISEQEIDKLKQQIDANEDLKKSMEWRKQLEDSTPKSENEEWNKRYEMTKSLQKDNPQAYSVGMQQMFSDMGLETYDNMSFDWTLHEEKAKNAFTNINKMWKDGQISFGDYMSANAQVVAQTWTNTTDNLKGTFENISALQNHENAKIARVGKAAAIASATMGAITSSINAYASAAAIPYVGYVLAPVAAAAALAAGMANVAAIRSQPTGYYSGGYTGNVSPKTAIPTNLHGKEYVFDHKTTEDIGLNKLDALRNGTAFIQHRGEHLEQNSVGANVNVTVENYGSNKVEVQQIDPYNIRIIVQEELNSMGENLVSNYLKTNDGKEQVAKIAKRG